MPYRNAPGRRYGYRFNGMWLVADYEDIFRIEID